MEIEQLLRLAHEQGASDLHITVGSPPILRIHGQLKPLPGEKLKPNETAEIARQLMTQEQDERFREKGEADFSYGIPQVSRFRINVYRQRGCVSLAIRTINSKVPSMEQLGLPPIARDFAEKPQGLFLVTGPTGSGKSTTLASMIDYINRTMYKHIITLEDPIEYLHLHQRCIIDQREVGQDTLSFANGLRAALRQDPDVILVGEMRDLETIATAISAAETGHLVFATLHTSDAPQTIDRIIDVFPPAQQQQVRIQLAAVLLGVMSQRLIPTADGNGRMAAIEVLVNTPAVANLIRSEKVHQIKSIMQTGIQQGMITMEQSLKQLIRSGHITESMARQYSVNFGDF
ncbi:type IV pilus twitching motility protein PilT [Microaerobacter geothermalis]|uniref:type IV pilus twitching motility protein PilT n=1 Tax=Microaerobacter geothermalis TaxID=674972 RepID=UPI001F44D0D6|nr:type IV pilus twitching motility protein PilT [Microaerobacter geothermalis]MCF6092696.1 type IV pilus twitching motility protein PilT [Microaerobacter geothermalis]